MRKGDVNGQDAQPIFEYLKAQGSHGGIQGTEGKGYPHPAEDTEQERREGQRYPVELHQVPHLEGWRNHQTLCSHHRAQRL